MKLFVPILFFVASTNVIDAVGNGRKAHLRNVESFHNNKIVQRLLEEVDEPDISAVPSLSAVPSVAVGTEPETTPTPPPASSNEETRAPAVPNETDSADVTNSTDVPDSKDSTDETDSKDSTDTTYSKDSADESSDSKESKDSGEYLEVQLQVLDTDYCINVPQKAQDGTSDMLKIWNCKPQKKKNQRFQISLDTGMVYAKISNATKCLTIDNNEKGKLFNGAPVQYADCGSTDDDLKQRWTWQADGDAMEGLLQSQWKPNKCVKGSTERGKTVRIDNCLNGDDLMWKMIDSRTGTF